MTYLDVLRALPGVVIWGLLPGLAVISLVAPHWSLSARLACSPGLSCGLWGVVGFIAHHLGIPLSALSGLGILIPLSGAALWRHHRWPSAHRFRHALGRAGAASALGAGALGVVLSMVAFHADLVPPQSDPAYHSFWATAIVTSGDINPLHPIPAIDSAYTRSRVGFETTVALTAETTATTPAYDLFPALLLSLLLLPLSVALLAKAFAAPRFVILLAPWLTIGLLFPSAPLFWGEYPLIVDSTLVVGAVLALLGWLRARDPQALGALAAIAVAVWVVHGLEAYTVAVLATPLVVAQLRRRPRATVVRLLIVALVVIASSLALIALSATKAPPLPSSITDPVIPLHAPISLAESISLVALLGVPGTLACLFTVLGAVAAFRRRASRPLVATCVITVAIVLDATVVGALVHVWVKLYPWSDVDRLLGLLFFSAPILMAFGVAEVARLLRHWRPRLRPAAGILTGALVIGLVANGALARFHLDAQSATSGDVVTAADIQVFAHLGEYLPSGSLVLNDGHDDAGKWIGSFTNAMPYYAETWSNIVAGPPEVAVADACHHQGAAAAAILNSGVAAVFIGDRSQDNDGSVWRFNCLTQLPILHLAVKATSDAGTAALFIVARPS